MFQRIVNSFRESSVPQPPRPPQMRLHTGRTLPAWALRVTCAVVLVICGVLVSTGYFSLVISVLGAVVVALAPWSGIPVTVVGVLAYLYVIGEANQLIAAVLLLGLHGVLTLTRLMGSVGPRAQVEVAALARVGAPFGVIQVFAQLMLHLAMGLPVLGGPVIWIAVATLAALLVLVVLLVRALRAVT